MLKVQNEKVLRFMKVRYTVDDVDELMSFLRASGTFEFPAFPNGLYPASPVTEGPSYTGYSHVWVRDNVYVALALHSHGLVSEARHNIEALATFFRRQADQFLAISRGEVDPSDTSRRPPIRFRAETLEPDGDWANAQNDALGYFLWMYARLATDGTIAMNGIAWDVLALFPPYLRAISYWRDEDNGHWEETPKVSASSIGAVVAGLRELLGLVRGKGRHTIPPVCRAALEPDLVEELLAFGFRALGAILPAECVQSDPLKQRRYDAALLFLVDPLDVVDLPMANQIVDDVRTQLLGDIGIRRYLGDSFWCADYRSKLAPDHRTRDWSSDLSMRNELVRPGEEAEWCLFDPFLSLIAGTNFRRTRTREFLEQQTHHLNRSLGHLTVATAAFPELRCPELYHRENGRYETSDATPLLWSQAGLLLALSSLRESVNAD